MGGATPPERGARGSALGVRACLCAARRGGVCGLEGCGAGEYEVRCRCCCGGGEWEWEWECECEGGRCAEDVEKLSLPVVYFG